MQHSAGPWRACGVLHCIQLGCEGLILGHYLLLYWISQTLLTDILLQNREGGPISLHQARQPSQKILDALEHHRHSQSQTTNDWTFWKPG